MYSLDVTLEGTLGVRDRMIAVLLEAIYQLDLIELRDDPSIPPLLASGVTYWSPACTARACPDAPWQGPTAILASRSRTADCKSLAAWRRAELFVRHGIETRFVVTRKIHDTMDVEYHICLQGRYHGEDIFEDISAMLGMERR